MSPTVLSVAYFGSPQASADVLSLLIAHANILRIRIPLVFSQPDKPAGRGMAMRKTPVRAIAEQHNITCFSGGVRGNLTQVLEAFRTQAIDLCILYAYHEIIPANILQAPRFGFWNIHPSLLPQYRGASPVTHALLMGDAHTGVSLVQMNAQLDAGDILGAHTIPLRSSDTHESIQNLITDASYTLLSQAILNKETLRHTPQDGTQATYTGKLTRADGYVPYPVLQALMAGSLLPSDSIDIFAKYYRYNTNSTPPLYIDQSHLYNMWRALHPWPGVWTEVLSKKGRTRLKIISMNQEHTGVITITHGQWEGKPITSWNSILQSIER